MLLNDEWKGLLADYRAYHSNPINEATHFVGIPMIVASLPWMLVPPVGLSMFTAGWALQFAGHAVQGNPPKFFGDKRNLLVGVVWWVDTALRPTGLNTVLFGEAPAAR